MKLSIRWLQRNEKKILYISIGVLTQFIGEPAVVEWLSPMGLAVVKSITAGLVVWKTYTSNPEKAPNNENPSVPTGGPART